MLRQGSAAPAYLCGIFMNRSVLRTVFRFLILVLALVALNIIGSAFFFRADLTQDKRFTLMPATRQLLEKLQDPLYIEVFLEGEFPAGFERLQRSVRETLDEFKAYAGDNIQYAFIDPSANKDETQRNETYRTLVNRGLQPTNLAADEDGKRSQKIIFPGAIVQQGGKEEAVTLLKGNQAASPQQRLNQSVEGVEYELAMALRKVTQKKPKRIAVIKGHGEKVGVEFNDLAASLKGLYQLDTVFLPNKMSLDGYDAALIIKPSQPFTEPDKYKLDQLAVNGGRLLFFLEPFPIVLDSLKPKENLFVPTDLNLTDLLFKFGARANADLVQDQNCASVPMVVGYMGNQPQTMPVPWFYFPIISNFASHPIMRNSDNLLFRFAGTVDTVGAQGIRKTVLARTGKYSRLVASPVEVSLNEASLRPDPALFNKSNLPLAVLLEGSFTSLYANRMAPETQAKFKFREKGMPGMVLVVNDGDLPLNEFNERKQIIYPIGYDRLTGITFGNKDFVLNALSYMLDDDGLIMARQKEVTLRPLDKPRLETEKTLWQTINLAGPLVLLFAFASGRAFLRRRKYTR